MKKKCKILIMVLCSHKNLNRLNAILSTWCQKIDPDNQSVLLLGDNELEKTFRAHSINLPRGVNFLNPHSGSLVYEESYWNLPKKIFNSFEFAFSKEWDFIFKCDDDTFLHIENLNKFVQNQINLHEIESCFCGSAVKAGPENLHRVLPKTYIELIDSCPFIYPQGGMGYLMSRSVAEKIRVQMGLMNSAGAEDAIMGLCARRAGISLKDTPGIFYRRSQRIAHARGRILKIDRNKELSSEDKKNLKVQYDLDLEEEIKITLNELKKNACSAHWIYPQLMWLFFDELYCKTC